MLLPIQTATTQWKFMKEIHISQTEAIICCEDERLKLKYVDP